MVGDRLILDAKQVGRGATGAQGRVPIEFAIVCPNCVDLEVGFVGVERQCIWSDSNDWTYKNPSVSSSKVLTSRIRAYRRHDAMLEPVGDSHHELRKMLGTNESTIPEGDRDICEVDVGTAGM